MANSVLLHTARDLKRASVQHDAPLWARLAEYMLKPSSARRNINIKRLGQLTKADDTVVFPGKVLGTGSIPHRITLYSFSISASALSKIKAAGGTAIAHDVLISQNPTGKEVVLLG